MKGPIATADSHEVRSRLVQILLLCSGCLLSAHLLADRPDDQYVQIFYRTDLNGEIDNDEEGVRGLQPYARYQSRGRDLCLNSDCIVSIHHGRLDRANPADRPESEKDSGDRLGRIKESNLFDLFVPLPGTASTTPIQDDYFSARTLRPGEHRRQRLGILHLLFYSLPDCSHESTALLNQVYRSQADADLFVVFLPDSIAGTCLQFESPENPYHSLYDPPEKQTARTLFLSRSDRFRYYRDRRGSYRCSVSAPHLARIRLHFRGRQLLGVEAAEERFRESERMYPL